MNIPGSLALLVLITVVGCSLGRDENASMTSLGRVQGQILKEAEFNRALEKWMHSKSSDQLTQNHQQTKKRQLANLFFKIHLVSKEAPERLNNSELQSELIQEFKDQVHGSKGYERFLSQSGYSQELLGKKLVVESWIREQAQNAIAETSDSEAEEWFQKHKNQLPQRQGYLLETYQWTYHTPKNQALRSGNLYKRVKHIVSHPPVDFSKHQDIFKPKKRKAWHASQKMSSDEERWARRSKKGSWSPIFIQDGQLFVHQFLGESFQKPHAFDSVKKKIGQGLRNQKIQKWEMQEWQRLFDKYQVESFIL